MENNKLGIIPEKWDLETDILVIGSGGAGLPAALKAQESGLRVMILEANWDVGGHAAISGGNMHSGAGTEIQKKYGIEDSADCYYTDHTVGDIVATRYNDRDYVRAIADNMVEAYDYIQAKGVKIIDRPPTKVKYYKDPEGGPEPESVARWTVVDRTDDNYECFIDGNCRGIYLTRPLEKSFRENGGTIVLNYHMDRIFREEGGKVVGVNASYTPTVLPGEDKPMHGLWDRMEPGVLGKSINIKAEKSIIIATGGSTGNVAFRTMIDPRLGPEYDGLSGMPFSDQDASGELAAMEIGASLGTLAQYMQRGGHQLVMATHFGVQYGYRSYGKNSPIFKLFRAKGIKSDYQSMIIVNMLGKRFENEDKCVGSKYNENAHDFYNAAFSSVLVPDENGVLTRYGGPLWAIFDQEAVERNQWDVSETGVDWADGRCFKADSIEELAGKIVNKYYEHIKMDPAVLADTVTKYNHAVEIGVDMEWGKTSLKYKIEKGPFYAAWAMPVLHDTYGGIRVDARMQVIDIHGKLIPGLYAAGESSAGMRVHGFGRVITSGYIAGRSAAE